MTRLRLGIELWNQGARWPEMLETARRVDRLGYDHLWTWDHLYAISGDPHQSVFEAWSVLAAWAMATDRVGLGLLVGANTLRNPGLVAKTATTLDHLSDGRAILGLGSGWFDLEHRAYGIEFGSGFGERLDWLDEATHACRLLLDGEAVTSLEEAHYRFVEAVGLPRPIQGHLPIMIGGVGERKTLATVARHADMWNAFGTPEVLAQKDAVLREHCVAVGRDPATIERTVLAEITIRDDPDVARQAWCDMLAYNRTPLEQSDGPDVVWAGTPVQVAQEIRSRSAVGFATVICQLPAPYDTETIERLISEVRPLVESEAPLEGDPK
jgi:alkanesulfonate monooxygenase SsuD/methylene tetrahydromethanopterin reductase-like flavin-dependent oxidoreductase (luciferase family)